MYIVADIEKIKSVFKKVMKNYCVCWSITSHNNYKAILIENDAVDLEDRAYMWIRLINVPDTALYDVEIANITLPINYRRVGFLTSIFNGLNNCKYVNKVKFISVCTEEMRAWCNKYELKPYCDGNNYTN